MFSVVSQIFALFEKYAIPLLRTNVYTTSFWVFLEERNVNSGSQVRCEGAPRMRTTRSKTLGCVSSAESRETIESWSSRTEQTVCAQGTTKFFSSGRTSLSFG